MANRNYTGERLFNMEKDPVMLFLQCNIGASGAPSNLLARGISSIVRDAAGQYTITLQDAYVKVMSLVGCGIAATAGTSSGVAAIELIASTNTANKIIKIQTVDAAGDVADPANGTVLDLQIMLRNSKIKIGND